MDQMYEQTINAHYGVDGLGAKLLSALQAAGKDPDALSREDLHAFDEIHIGGVQWTRNLAQFAGIRAGDAVLDIGCGLGGPARTLAAEFGCTVTGLEITEAFCQAAEMLTQRVGLSGQVTFRQGSALDLPFDDESFDVVWMQHVAMNIPDKLQLFREARRVLKPGGWMAMHTILAGEVHPIYYPVIWAADPEIDFIEPAAAFRQAAGEAGFEETAWEDVTQRETEWYQAAFAQMASAAPGRPPIFAVFVKNLGDKAKNTLRNLEEDRIAVAQALYQKGAASPRP